MRFLIMLALPLFAQAQPLFDPFIGNYHVNTRWCVPADPICAATEFVHVTAGRNGQNLIFETDANGNTILTTEIMQNNTATEIYFVTGTLNIEALWTHQVEAGDGTWQIEDLSLTRARR